MLEQESGHVVNLDLDGNLPVAEDVVETTFVPDIHLQGPSHGVVPSIE